MLRLLLLILLLASPLWGQATPSIAPAQEQRGVVSLREYIDIRINALSDVIKAEGAAQQKATEKAEGSINQRLEGFPETFASKAEFVARSDAVDKRLAAIELRIAGFDGSLVVLLGVWVVLQALIGIFIARWIARANGKQRVPD